MTLPGCGAFVISKKRIFICCIEKRVQILRGIENYKEKLICKEDCTEEGIREREQTVLKDEQ
jgi:putative lipase involved disintegration of autophagic bodies